MHWFRRGPASSEKSQEGPPPYDDDPPSVPKKTSPSDSTRTVASGPPIIAGKKSKYWIDWSKKPAFKNRNPGLLGVWPHESRLQRGHGLLFRMRASWNQMASLHPGEMENVIHPVQDWTKHWGWAITIKIPSDPDQSTSRRDCHLRILVKDLPARLRDKEISWKSANWKSQCDKIQYKKEISQKESYYVRFLAFSTPEPVKEKSLHSRSWVGEVCVRHQDKEWLKNHDFRTALSPENIKTAEIDRRTASGRCKKVVMFRRGVLYGNDMTGQRVEAWKDEFAESFGAFIKPILSWQRLGGK